MKGVLKGKSCWTEAASDQTAWMDGRRDWKVGHGQYRMDYQPIPSRMTYHPDPEQAAIRADAKCPSMTSHFPMAACREIKTDGDPCSADASIRNTAWEDTRRRNADRTMEYVLLYQTASK